MEIVALVGFADEDNKYHYCRVLGKFRKLCLARSMKKFLKKQKEV